MNDFDPLEPPWPRRQLLRCAGGLALGGGWLAQPALAAPPMPLSPTPSQTEGPFYPVALPVDRDGDLLQNGALGYRRGQAVQLSGRVLDTAGRPLRGAEVEIWQCDEDGHYHHPGDGGRADPAFQGFGRVAVDELGRYRFRTLRPAAYSGRTPHIHVKVKQGGRTLLTTQLYVEGDAGNARDPLWRSLDAAARQALTVPFRPPSPISAELQAEFGIVVRV